MLFLQNGHSANVFAQLSSAQKVQTLISSSFSQTANELPVLPWPGVEPQLLVLFWLGQKQSKDCSFCSEAVPTVLYIISSLALRPWNLQRWTKSLVVELKAYRKKSLISRLKTFEHFNDKLFT